MISIFVMLNINLKKFNKVYNVSNKYYVFVGKLTATSNIDDPIV